MSALDEVQAFMARALRERRALHKDPEITRRAAELFAGNERLSPVEQLEIYREQFWLRHTTALLEDYPGLSGILGQRDWERLVEEYLVSRASLGFSLRDLGEALPGFVAAEPPWLEHPRLAADMARLEWAYVELFDAAWPPRLDPARLAAVGEAWAEARVVLSPALRLLRVDYPVVELRKRLRTPGDAPVTIPVRSPHCLLIYRAELKILHDVLDPVPFTLLEALAAGLPLGGACERACALEPGAAARVNAEVGAWFSGWAAKGLVVDVVAHSVA